MFARCNSNVERPSNKLLVVAAVSLRVANLFLASKFIWINGGYSNPGFIASIASLSGPRFIYVNMWFRAVICQSSD